MIEPDPILRKISAPLEKVDKHTRKLMDDMLETMYEAPGIGLAAVQVGVLKKTYSDRYFKGRTRKESFVFNKS